MAFFQLFNPILAVFEPLNVIFGAPLQPLKKLPPPLFLTLATPLLIPLGI